VRTGEWEWGFGVIEAGAAPARGSSVTNRAIERESGGDMVRIRCALVLSKVASITVFGSTGEGGLRVTLIALHGGVSTGERERSFGVIERGVVPVHRAVADGAVERKAHGCVIGIVGSVVKRKMTGVAVSWRASELAADVAQIARDSSVPAGEGEWRFGVIEGGAGPIDCAMADGAIEWENLLHVARIRCSVIKRQMTGVTVRWHAGESAARMALVTVQGGVRAGKGESCLRVIENSIAPVHCAVAE